MAEEQNEYSLPIGNNESRKTARLLPRYYRTESNKKFLQATVDQLTQSGTVKKINGYIGRKNAKAVTGSDVFVDAPTQDRSNYQLEPSLVSTDDLGNVNFFKDYLDYTNTVEVLGGLVDNHQRINKQEFYSWDPHINWDKFVNFQQYYWLPYGPNSITIEGQQKEIISTYTVRLSDEGDNRTFVFTPNGLSRNPTIKLYRGQTYQFDIDCPGELFSIKTKKESGDLFRYTKNVSASSVEKGVITFTISDDAPNVLYYVSENSVEVSGILQIYDIKENTEINVETEIIGKKSYTLPNGISLSNGMKVNFSGKVIPEKYSNDNFYVEGVGDKISLISEKSLQIITGYATNYEILFDDAAFDTLPFSDATSYAGKKDYVTINRSNTDGNPWSRYNRWFHIDVITKTSEITGSNLIVDQAQRATRPIIEFESNLKLFNFGTVSKTEVDLIDLYTTDVFSTVEGSLGYYVDGVQLVENQRVLFAADRDNLVKGKIYRVKFLRVTPTDQATRRQIHLIEEEDAAPLLNETVLIKQGIENQGKVFWFNGIDWKKAQEKLSVNQSPLFDLFDNENVSLGDPEKYQGSTFKGNKIFSYKIGNGVKDPELEFSLSYRNINNIGDIVFTFDLLQNSFFYKSGVDVLTEKTDSKYLKKITGLETGEYVNGWVKNIVDNVQPIIRVFKDSSYTDKFPVDVYDYIDQLSDLKVKVYINGKRLEKEKYTIQDGPIYKIVALNQKIKPTEILSLKCYSAQKKNQNGYYEIPVNLQNNPLNDNINDFTLGEVIDHVDSIVDNLENFAGTYPGLGNLRDISNLSSYGLKFVQHSGPLNFGMYHLTSKNSNVIKALKQARDEYGKFKRNFVNLSKNFVLETDVKKVVDDIMFEINKDKPETSPYYFADMIGFGASTKTDYDILDGRIKTYPLSSIFSLNELSTKAVNVYLNNIQLIHEKEYIFNSSGFVEILVPLAKGNLLTVYEYESTNGCCIPPTPTALGLWPKYEPRKYLDTTLLDPKNVIQGHDGSIILAYDDYRDDLILELEKRIFNNIKVKYDTTILDIYDFIPGYNRKVDYTLDEFNKLLAPNFYQWTTLIDRDFSKQFEYNPNNSFTFNYGNNPGPDGAPLPGFWRGAYKWLFDTDRVHICPWESLGFTIQPKWWVEVYGPAPYTKDNLILWDDLKNGVIREPGKPVIRNNKFLRPVLDFIPVDEHGKLLSPLDANISKGYFGNQVSNDFVFGDQAPVETAWRRSSYYPFSVLSTMILMEPNKVLGSYIDRSRIVRNKNDQLIYKDTNLRIKLKDLVLPSIASDDTQVSTSGLINYIVDYILSDNLRSLKTYRSDLTTLTNKLSHRLGGFTSKEKFNLILDSKSPLANAGVFIPKENYNVFLNISSPVKKLVYSGVIVTKLVTKYGSGFEVRGYNQNTPFFNYYAWTQSGSPINVGGISESFINWAPGQTYVAGNIVKYNNVYYRVKTNHVSQTNIDLAVLQKLPSLPIIGGQDAILRKNWDRTPIVLNYGHVFLSIQDVVDFLQGYGEYLKDQGFVFDDYNTDLKSVSSWETSVKEFLFWTTQNWSPGEDKFVDWLPETEFKTDVIVSYNGDYYRTKMTHTTGNSFDSSLYKKIDALSQNGASVIALSPGALGLSLNLQYSVVDNLRDDFNDYEIYRADGTKFDQNFLNYTRDNNTFSLFNKTL